MNILYLKYAAEVAKTGSINKAAEVLYVAQPNVSRAIKELEASLGITIFDRTPKGMTLTHDGERLMKYARTILSQIDEVEKVFRNEDRKKLRFSISVPRAEYISEAFANFTNKLPKAVPAEIFYNETNALCAVNNILNSDYDLGIIRYSERYDKNFKEMLLEKGLAGELVAEFCRVIVMSREHPLAERQLINYNDLKPYTEISDGDPYVPAVPLYETRNEALSEGVERCILVFDRASRIELLARDHDTFMRTSPLPEETLKRSGLIQKRCPQDTGMYKDVLIRRKDYSLTSLDKMFVTELCESKRKYL